MSTIACYDADDNDEDVHASLFTSVTSVHVTVPFWSMCCKSQDIRHFYGVCFQEMILDKVEGKEVPRFLVYDIIKFEVGDVSLS